MCGEVEINADKITFTHPIGMQDNGNYIPREVLLTAYIDKIGTKMECETCCGFEYIINGVDATDDFVFIDCIRIVE